MIWGFVNFFAVWPDGALFDDLPQKGIFKENPAKGGGVGSWELIPGEKHGMIKKKRDTFVERKSIKEFLIK